MATARNGWRARGAFEPAVLAVLLGSASTAHAAEAVDLKFDWGADLTILRDMAAVRDVPLPEAKAPDPMGGAPSPATPSAGANPAPVSPLVAPSTVRREVPAMRYRLAAKRQTDGSYEVRTLDFLMRTGMGDLLISQQPSARQVIDTTAPALRIDGRGAFVALLEPDAATAAIKGLETGFEARLRSLPPPQQAEARTQLEEIRSEGYLAARAAFPWFESVGFWSGRRLEFGRWYSESAEERYVPLATARGPARVQRRWRAVGWAPCEEPLPAAAPRPAGTSEASPKKPAAARGECVRLNLVSTFTPASPPLGAQPEGRLDPRLESEIDLVTEPATLRPRRAVVTWRSRWREANGAEGVKDVQTQRLGWTYGPPALVALQGTLPSPPIASPVPVEPANLKPKPEWAPGTPERAYVDFRAAVDSGDWSTAAALMHPEFLARVAKRLRSQDGVKDSGELRNALFGDEVTAEQVEASSDLALVLLATKRLADQQRDASGDWTRPPRLSPARVVLGHVEDREGRRHVVTQQDVEYRMPVEYRGSSSTVVLSLADQRSAPAGAGDAAAPGSSCDPARDVHRCWRVWRDSSSEYEPLSRVQSELAMRRRPPTGTGATAVPGTPALSSAQPPGAATAANDPETLALRSALQKLMSEALSTGAKRPDLAALRAVVGSPAFARLNPAEQYQARIGLGQGLLMNGELAEGLPLTRESAQSPLGRPANYQVWAGTAAQLRQRAEAARAIQAWLTRFPASGDLLDPRLLAEIDAEPPVTDEEKREFRRLYEALFAAGDQLRDADGLDGRWVRLARLRLEDRALPDPTTAAAEVVRRIDDSRSLMAMRADRRYDALTRAHPELFDLARARASVLGAAERKVQAEPRVLARRVALLRTLLRSGQARQALDQATNLVDSLGVADAPEVTLRDAPPPLPFDDAKEQLRWLYDLRAQALVRLGRFEEALQDNRRAVQAARYSQDSVSQSFNSAIRAAELGMPQEAMELLSRTQRRASSPYGRMVYEAARLQAAQQLGDRAIVERALGYLADNRDDAPTFYLFALLYLPAEGERTAAAEAEFLRLLDHPEHRLQLLYFLQGTAPPVRPLPQRDRTIAELKALAQTPRMREAVNRVGRILDYPDVPYPAE
jgi:tetratricopeptide (TPR) repeat protein